MGNNYDASAHLAEMQLLREDLESQKKRELSLVKECTRLMNANVTLVQSLDKKNNKINCLEQELREAQQEKLKAQIGLCLEESKVHTAMEDIQKSKRETKNIVDAYKKQAKRLQSIQGKRKHGEVGADKMIEGISQVKRPKPRVVACTQCYSKGWRCDNGSPCHNCTVRHKEKTCKRVKCEYFPKFTCTKQSCTLAHEEDDYPVLIPHVKMRQKRDRGDSPARARLEYIKAPNEKKDINGKS